MPKLCLNMIVRNESARIVRCLESLAPWLDYWVVYDTGSTDNTVELIEEFFKGRGIPGHALRGKFVNFEQARNAALDAAREADYPWDYLLLCDADMELVVEDKNFKDQLKGGLCYDVVQTGGSVSYYNKRFVSRAATGKYMGVTHEYLDVAGAGPITGVRYVDHADGANRVDKFKRDIALLSAALKKEPNNGRYWFYLAQSYRDAGEHEKAAKAYLKRIALGGWDEEVWNARFNYAHALGSMGKENDFVSELLRAYNERPHRAEPLYDLAKHYREKGMNHAALAICEEGLKIPYPKNDVLFINDFVYSTGFREEFSIAAFYDEKRRVRGFDTCNKLTLDRKVPHWSRELAKNNLFHYLQPLCKFCPSFTTRRIAFTPPDQYLPMNPSMVTIGDKIIVNIRAVNYSMDEYGRYLIRKTGAEANNSNPIDTRNFLLELNPSFKVLDSNELSMRYIPPPKWGLVTGWEDMRLFTWQGGTWCHATVRDQNTEGWCEQFIGRILPDDVTFAPCITQIKRINVEPKAHEKNWMAVVTPNGGLQFVYRLGHLIDISGKTTQKVSPVLDLDHISGGSGLVPFHGGYLAIVHESRPRPDTGKRFYQHRFVYFDTDCKPQMITAPFVFLDKVIEFASGLAWHPDGKRLMISYGIDDREAWIATVFDTDISEMLGK